MAETPGSARAKVYDALRFAPGLTWRERKVELFLFAAILINVAAVVLETSEGVVARYGLLFKAVEIASLTIFTVEYLLRLWSAPEAPGFRTMPEGRARLRWALTPMALVDLLAVAPVIVLMLGDYDATFLLALRMVRVLKLTRYSRGVNILVEVFIAKADVFLASMFILAILLVVTASGAYLAENPAGTPGFESILAAMWWAVATLTTVGYGDVTPQTGWGQFFGAVVTVIGVGVAALPAGILASGLAEEMDSRREKLHAAGRRMLADGALGPEERAALERMRLRLGLSRRDMAETLRRARRGVEGGE